MPSYDIDLAAFTAALGTDVRVMGLDFGDRTIGMAVSDPARRTASAVGTLRRRKFTDDAEDLFSAMDDRGVGGLVVGLPLNMDGTAGKRVQQTRQFAHNLLRLRDMPIVFRDERLSTVAVDRAMVREADLSRAKRARSVDAAAAAFILQGALDAMSAVDPR